MYDLWLYHITPCLFTKGPQVPYMFLHSAKGGAVETGCSELYDVIHYFTL